MEPPSPTNADQAHKADRISDDPLLQDIFSDTFLVVTRPAGEDDPGEGNWTVCAYSARTGLSYLGKSSSISS